MRSEIFAIARPAVVVSALIQVLTAASALAQPSMADLPLPLNSWRFNDTNWLPGMHDAPRTFGNLENIASWDGNALLLSRRLHRFLLPEPAHTS